MSQGENDCEMVIQRLTSTIREGAQKAESLFSKKACIYSVPKELRKLNESAYTPRLIAIGPLHQNDPHLQTPMQNVKLSYMNQLLCRMTQGMENQEAEKKKITVLQECVVAMEMSIEDAKKCYAEEVTLDVEMMLVDGCFILEFLYKCDLYYNNSPEGLEDPILAKDFIRIDLQFDLVLLENQIPFLVLERLFPLTLARIPNRLNKNLSLTDYVLLPTIAHCWMNTGEGNSTNSCSTKTSCWPRDCVIWVSGNEMNNTKPEEEVSSHNSNYDHILHKLHDDFLPHDKKGKDEPCEIMPSASELVYAGVKFVPGTGNNVFKVKFTEPKGPFWLFRSSHFEIPCVEIYDQTELLLRNLIAFEQCCPGILQHFTSYSNLMDMLVQSDIDVQVLQKAGVLKNNLGASEEVTDLFNKLGKEILIGNMLFADTCNRVTRYSKRFWPKNMAYLRRQYFASPWKFIAFCLGFVYLGLTISQLIVSIMKE